MVAAFYVAQLVDPSFVYNVSYDRFRVRAAIEYLQNLLEVESHFLYLYGKFEVLKGSFLVAKQPLVQMEWCYNAAEESPLARKLLWVLRRDHIDEKKRPESLARDYTKFGYMSLKIVVFLLDDPCFLTLT